ncbi:hypothetical protein JTB14_006588 [Gonioctena quinquepunctata]|nr:hypothetical protein JTB14_006588 [Gonioctena quinquepunctata]
MSRNHVKCKVRADILRKEKHRIKFFHGSKLFEKTITQWRHTSSPAAKKSKTSISGKQIIAIMFWDRNGIILIEYLPRGQTINAARHCETLSNLERAIQNKQRGMLTKGVCFATKALLDSFNWDVLNPPCILPHLAHSDFQLFTFLKTHMGEIEKLTDEEERQEVSNWKEMAGEFFEESIIKLVPRLTTSITERRPRKKISDIFIKKTL